MARGTSEPAAPSTPTRSRKRCNNEEEGELTRLQTEEEISPVRKRTQLRIRSLSTDDFPGLEDILPSPLKEGEKKLSMPNSPEKVEAEMKKVEGEIEPTLLMSETDFGRRLQKSGEDFLARHETEWPMLTAHIEMFIYSFDFAIRSTRWFQFGFTALFLGVRLIVYSLILLPAFLQICWAYFHDPRIHRRIPYFKMPRNYIDLYIPKEAVAAQEGKGKKVPVVIAVMGGAWVMGHRAWNAQLGLRLMDFGVLVVAVDYRNFPIGYVPDMVDDLNKAMSWAFANIETYGGDKSNVMLIAQSAGAHLSTLLLLEHSLLEARDDLATKKSQTEQSSPEVTDDGAVRRQSGTMPLPDGWSTKDLKLYLAVSGPFDLVALEPHLNSRGIYSKILYSLTVDGDLTGCSPTRVLRESDWRKHHGIAAPRLPPIYLFHGGKDKSVPTWSSKDFYEALKDTGVTNVTLDVRPSYTHTYPVIEGPMAGDDPQVELMLPVLFGEKKAKQMLKESPGKRLWPQVLIDVAGSIMPY